MAEVVDSGASSRFFWFNRAKHAVVEAAILATRVHFLPREEILADFARLNVLVEKTGGAQERRAFDFLEALRSRRLCTAARESNRRRPTTRILPRTRPRTTH